MKKLILCTFLCSLMYASLHAQTAPRVMSYQGVLRPAGNAAGNQIAGNRILTVTLYGDPSGTVKIWQSSINTSVDSSGLFNCLLGTPDNPLPSPAVMNQPLWIGVAVDSGSEMRPLSPLTAVPYAVNVADSSITAAKIATNYVSAVTIDGTQITSQGSALNLLSGGGIQFQFDSSSNSVTANLALAPIANDLSGYDWSEHGNTLGSDLFTPYLGTSDTTDLVIKTDGSESMRILGHGGDTQGYVGINTSTPVSRLEVLQSNSATTGVQDVVTITRETTGTPAPTFGAGLPFRLGVNGSSTPVDAARFQTSWNDATSAEYSSTFELDIASRGVLSRELRIDTHDQTLNNEFEQRNITFGFNNGTSGNTIDTNINGGTISGGGGFTDVGGSEWDDHGADTFNYVISDFGTVGGGSGNTAGSDSVSGAPQFQSVGGGIENRAEGDDAAIPGGEFNTVSGNHSAIGGGSTNIVRGDESTISGGANNTDNGADGSITGGHWNYTDGQYSSVLGGNHNLADGYYSSILGGGYLQLGDSSFGFSAASGFTYTIPQATSIGYFGNVDLWIGNVDSVARGLRFYSPNNDFSYGNTSYFSSFKAGVQTDSILYTLPTSLPTTGEVLGAASVSPPNVTLSWMSGGGGGAGWQLMGNSGVPPPSYYLGTNDNEAFEIHVHNNTLDTTGGNQRVMQYSEGSSSPNMLGGSSFNTLGPGLTGAAIFSGGTKVNPNILNFTDTFSVVLSGTANVMDSFAPYSAILSGQGNHIAGDTTVSGFGWHNGFDVIAGGQNNFMGAYPGVRSGFNFIGSGESDTIGWGCYDNVIAGGKDNLLADAYGSIGGGIGNLLNGPGALCVIAGGYYNTVGGDISVNAGPIYASSILGGDSNMIRQYASYSTIAGGTHNTIDTSSLYSAIGGGSDNYIGGTQFTPQIVPPEDTFPGPNNVIAGGDSNSILGAYSSIGGGLQNTISKFVSFATIPGGDSLIATINAQTVIGEYNVPTFSYAPPLAVADDAEFIIGNGTPGNRSNGFTVSYAGYSTAYDTIGSGGADTIGGTHYPTATVMGSTYARNTIIAWGNVGPVPGPKPLDSADIGVFNITYDTSTGEYSIVLNVNDPNGLAHQFKQGQCSVVASITQGLSGTPGIIEVTSIDPGTSTFHVKTWPQSSMTPTNTFGFMFQVVAR